MTRIARLIAAALVAVAMAVAMAAPTLAAPAISFPDSIGYNDDADLAITGLVPGAPYIFKTYEPNAGPIFTFDFQARPDGTYRDTFGADFETRAGAALFEVTTPDGTVVARKMVTLVGASPYFRPSRLGT